MADPVPAAAPAKAAAPAPAPAPTPAPAAPVPPTAITLSADYAWFVEGAFFHRPAGTRITDAGEIARLIEMNAKFTAA